MRHRPGTRRNIFNPTSAISPDSAGQGDLGHVRAVFRIRIPALCDAHVFSLIKFATSAASSGNILTHPWDHSGLCFAARFSVETITVVIKFDLLCDLVFRVRRLFLRFTAYFLRSGAMVPPYTFLLGDCPAAQSRLVGGIHRGIRS